ncbi:bifunctional riboflavin kinase/FAD synthetase [bacterium]|nr:bifunctional riboflavin kinase/FAD synthetase [bacterium]
MTVGTFDGVHLGHRAIVETVRETARETSRYPVVITFDPHPRKIVRDGMDVALIDSVEERLSHLSALGVEHVCVIPFTHELAKLTPAQFVTDILLREFNAKVVVIGFDHAFGKGRSGDRESLTILGKEAGFEVRVVPPVYVGETVVSSTAIRRRLSEGDVSTASQMLGRYYEVCGVIVHGHGRGRKLNCPTANLARIPSSKIMVRNGIYAGLAEIGGYSYPAAVSVGYNPTFEDRAHSVEAHLLDVDFDMYDQEMRVQFVKRLRGEVKFDGAAALALQIQDDLFRIREMLQAAGCSLAPERISTIQDTQQDK